MSDLNQIYDAGFFEHVDETALQAARRVVPIVTDLLHPASVIDVGCGRGGWLSVFRENGVESIQGVDGDYVDRSRLLIPSSSFRSIDLAGPFQIEGKYDLAVSLEVAEHIAAANADRLVEQLVGCAPFVLFSAAIPNQGGTHHVNERMPAYWHRRFAQHGYVALDPVRPKILSDRSVEYWYRQNILLYGLRDAVLASPRLAAEPQLAIGYELEWVHARIVNGMAGRYIGVGRLLRELVKAVIGRSGPKFEAP